MSVTRLSVVGTGLIGASLGLAASRQGIEVVGWDPDATALVVAKERGAIATAADSVAAAVAGADLVVVATPIQSLPARVAEVLAAVGPTTTVTDVGSTKASVVAAASGSPRFVGGHPIAGSEARGPENANADIFEGATWFLTPTGDTDPESHRLLHGFVSDLGATPIAIDAESHDRLVALTSHVPHVLANVVANQTGAGKIAGHEPLANAGGSLRDMTRIAGANPKIWIDIFLDNADAVTDALVEHRRRIEEVEGALRRRDADFLAGWIGEAADNRRRMLDRAYNDAGALHRVRVHVSDEPGVFAGITQALGAERINIEDFELQHISPERGGTLSILIEGEAEARRAATMLEAQGYGVSVSAVLDEG
ncbi:MAG: prephenate dehydrogenase/arogenate dehydrogenase family protein [Actinobacteria bacterium]|uniref:Prephenate dehydrogenase n=1 Tax=freshwater metagenome TaxID=449393 RepID=A0A6J6P1Z1_9ZZZZ|nr:prephenate dehydrogenase/arogenate dehydrogenase family protein [Actinomycetota bacterium]